MAFPYFPHATAVTVTISVKGHQMESISRSLTLTKDKHGMHICGQFADTVLSAIELATAVVDRPKVKP